MRTRRWNPTSLVFASLFVALGAPSLSTAAGQPCTPDAKISLNQSTVPEVKANGDPSDVSLNGSSSKGDTFLWSQDPTDPIQVTLSNAASKSASFTAPAVGIGGTTLHFSLTASCTGGASDTKSAAISITNVNQPPVPNAGVDDIVLEGALVTLTGTATDPDNDSLTYQWTQLSGTTVTLSGANTSIATFTAPAPDTEAGVTLKFRLTVSDGFISKFDDKFVNVMWVNNPPDPVLVCPTQPVAEGLPVTLDASGTTDDDDLPPTFAWEQVNGPPDTGVGGKTGSTVSFTVPQLVFGDYTSLTFRVIVTDSHGLSSSETCNVLLKDITPPVLTVGSNPPVEATMISGAQVTLNVTASDQLDGNLTPSCAPASGSIFPVGSTAVTCSATDAAGNTSSTTFGITVLDGVAPTIAPHADVTAEATSGAGAVVAYTAPGVTDNISTGLVATCLPASNTQFALGDTTVNCSATDGAGNTGTSSFVVHVVDTTAPTISNMPNDITLEATGPGGAAASWSAPTASDLVDGSRPVTCSPASGSTFPVGMTTVNCSASDTHGNSASKSFKVIVTDTTPPTITTPGNLTAEATGPSGAPVSFSVSASDLVAGSVPVTCTPSSGSTFPIGLPVGVTTVNCSASDGNGNTATASFTVTVRDTTPPSLSLPANISQEATGPSGNAVTYAATANDIVDGSVAVTCAPASGSTFPVTTTTVSCSATDAHGNTANGSFTVEIRDTTPPDVTTPASVTGVEATGPGGAAVTFSASALDIVDGVTSVNCVPASGSTFPITTTTVNCSSTDAHGNTGSKSFPVTVVDTTPPTITVPSDITKEATGPNGAAVTFTTSASDIVDGATTVSCAPASGSTFPLGATTVTCSSTDAHNNTATKSFKVTVVDTTPPALTTPGNLTAEATGPSGAPVTFSVTAVDIVAGNVPVTCTPSSGSTFPLGMPVGVTTVNCSASDGNGNTGSASFTVTVKDTTAPALTLPGNITVEASGPGGAVVTYSASALDVVDGAITPICSPASGSAFAIGATTSGVTTVNCSASDTRGNTASGSFTVTVRDTTAPTITVPSDIATFATGPTGAVVNYSVSGNDIVDGPVAVSCAPASGSTFAVGTTTVNCGVTDKHGNAASKAFNVSVTYNFAGFFQPINMSALNSVKAGSAIPVKFTLGGYMGMDVIAAGYPRVVNASCSAGWVDTILDTETVTAGSSSLNYDSTTGQYVYVWKSDKLWVGRCLQLQVKLKDGTTQVASFAFTK